MGIEIRKTIASSIHEIARIVGPKIVEEDLFKVLDILLKDKSLFPLHYLIQEVFLYFQRP